MLFYRDGRTAEGQPVRLPIMFSFMPPAPWTPVAESPIADRLFWRVRLPTIEAVRYFQLRQ